MPIGLDFLQARRNSGGLELFQAGLISGGLELFQAQVIPGPNTKRHEKPITQFVSASGRLGLGACIRNNMIL
jgi:hypothetical protein